MGHINDYKNGRNPNLQRGGRPGGREKGRVARRQPCMWRQQNRPFGSVPPRGFERGSIDRIPVGHRRKAAASRYRAAGCKKDYRIFHCAVMGPAQQRNIGYFSVSLSVQLSRETQLLGESRSEARRDGQTNAARAKFSAASACWARVSMPWGCMLILPKHELRGTWFLVTCLVEKHRFAIDKCLGTRTRVSTQSPEVSRRLRSRGRVFPELAMRRLYRSLHGKLSPHRFAHKRVGTPGRFPSAGRTRKRPHTSGASCTRAYSVA